MLTPLSVLSAHFNPATLQVSVNISLIVPHESSQPQIGHSLLAVTPLCERRTGNTCQLGDFIGT
jgi:hypothetical protein